MRPSNSAPPSEASSSEASEDESPSHPAPQGDEELRRRVGYPLSSESSSSEDEDAIPGSERDGADDEIVYVPMGERVERLMNGPSIGRSRHAQFPRPSAGSGGNHERGVHGDVQLGRAGVDAPEGIKRRLNKHAPVEEQISRRPVNVLRDAVQKKSVKHLDPRFMARNHHAEQREEDMARRRYAFLYDQAMPGEVKALKAALRKSTDPSEQRRLQVKLSRLQETLQRHDNRTLELEVEREWRDKERAKIEAGKTPFYLKDSEKKKRVLEKKFARLEETGQLEKYMAKKRKRVSSKMHKKLPFRRNHDESGT